jgi:hypothetical protein
MRFSWLALASTVLGLLAGVAFHGTALGNLTGYQLAAAMTPPTLQTGYWPLLNCGWHGACTSPPTSGTGLDWEDGGTGYGLPWYFRSFVYWSGTYNKRVATGAPLVSVQNPDKCDVMTVWIIYYHCGALRGIPTYVHTAILNFAQFPINGGPWTYYNGRLVGATINDTGSECPFGGSHVHENDVPYRTDIVTTTRNTGLYPAASTCSSDCGYFQNNNINNWTRRFAWAEGAE